MPLSGTKRSADDMDTDSEPEAAQAEPVQQPQPHGRRWRERPLQAQQPAAAQPAASSRRHASQGTLGSSEWEVSASDLPVLHTMVVRLLSFQLPGDISSMPYGKTTAAFHAVWPLHARSTCRCSSSHAMVAVLLCKSILDSVCMRAPLAGV